LHGNYGIDSVEKLKKSIVVGCMVLGRKPGGKQVLEDVFGDNNDF
jgi:hypothetical protein